MATLIINEKSASAQQFLKFAGTLPYVDVLNSNEMPEKKLKPAVSTALKQSEQGKNLIVCKDADDMFEKLGI
jgi:hypothetical protein